MKSKVSAHGRAIPLFHPLHAVAYAAAIALAYLALSLLGWRVYTAFLCGTFVAGESATACLVKGAAYACTYFAYVLAAPALLIGAGVQSVLLHVFCRGRRPAPASGDVRSGEEREA